MMEGIYRHSWLARRLAAIFGTPQEEVHHAVEVNTQAQMAVEEAVDCYEAGDIVGAREIAMEAGLRAPFLVEELAARTGGDRHPDIIALAREAHEILGEPYHPARTMAELAADLYHYGDRRMATEICDIQCIGASEFVGALRDRFSYSISAAISIAIDLVGLSQNAARDITQRAALVKILREVEEEREAAAVRQVQEGPSVAVEKLSRLDKEAAGLRAAHGWSRPGETVARVETENGELLVVADGYGGAALVEVQGIYPVGCSLISRQEFETEAEAVGAFESLCATENKETIGVKL